MGFVHRVEALKQAALRVRAQQTHAATLAHIPLIEEAPLGHFLKRVECGIVRGIKVVFHGQVATDTLDG